MVISDEILEAAQVTEAEIRAEIALALFARERLTLGQAARVADLPQLDFQALLATRKIAIHYGIAELEEDLSVFGDRDDALPSFHDDYLVGYKVDCKARVIGLHIMAATLEQGTISTVTLAGVEGYRFENDAFGNIILSLEAVTLTQFISDFGSEIRESHRLGQKGTGKDGAGCLGARLRRAARGRHPPRFAGLGLQGDRLRARYSRRNRQVTHQQGPRGTCEALGT